MAQSCVDPIWAAWSKSSEQVKNSLPPLPVHVNGHDPSLFCEMVHCKSAPLPSPGGPEEGNSVSASKPLFVAAVGSTKISSPTAFGPPVTVRVPAARENVLPEVPSVVSSTYKLSVFKFSWMRKPLYSIEPS